MDKKSAKASACWKRGLLRHFAAPLITIVMVFGFTISPLASAAYAQSSYDLAAQLSQLMQWWPGEYDNHEQIVRQSGGGLSPLTDTPYFRLHSVVTRMESPALGKNVLRVTEYRNNDASRIVRDRIYVLNVDEQAASLRVSQYAMPSSSGSSSPTSTPPLPLANCDLLMRFVGGQFEGGVSDLRCKQQDGYAGHKVVVGPRYMWVTSGMPTQNNDGWFQETRARFFACTVHENANGVMRETHPLTTIRLHDQGGEADIAWPDGRTLTFTIHTRAFTDPPDREYPLFRIHEKGKVVPIAYAYAVDGAKRFGLNLGWFYIRCYAEDDWATTEGPLPK